MPDKIKIGSICKQITLNFSSDSSPFVLVGDIKDGNIYHVHYSRVLGKFPEVNVSQMSYAPITCFVLSTEEEIYLDAY